MFSKILKTLRRIVISLLLLGCMMSALPVAPESNSNPQDYQIICMDYGCVDGIIAGVTSVTEAGRLLEARYGDLTFDRQGGDLRWTTETYSGSIVTRENTVEMVNISINEFSVSDLISKIGEPSTVWVAVSFSSEVLCAGAFLFYSDFGILAWLSPQGSSVGVSASQTISGLEFISLAHAETFSVTDTWVLEWQGYADYCALANP